MFYTCIFASTSFLQIAWNWLGYFSKKKKKKFTLLHYLASDVFTGRTGGR